jgi:diguanylate cyclase (GGDEF)-like protein/PAS domain S-box-containing protein
MSADPVKVLLIEDDENDYLLTRRLLSKAEGRLFEVAWVSTFEAALEALRRSPAQVMLLDYRLGDHDGLELLHAAKALGYRAPIIFLTGQGSYQVDMEAMRAGAADFLVKDQLTPALLERTIRYALERQQSADALQRAHDALETRVQERTQELARAIDGLNDEIAGRMEVEKELRASEERFRQIAENIEAVWWLRDPRQATMLYVSPRCREVLGVAPEVFYHNPQVLLELVHADDRERVRAATAQQAVGAYSEECRIVRPDGQTRWVRDRAFPIRDLDGAVYRIVGIIEDITERRQAEEHLRYISSHDVLTDLYNRFYFEEELARLERGRSYPVSVVSVDVDGLKQVNDRWGHSAGDELLRKTAQVLRLAFRNEDLIARVGGDEFVVLLPAADAAAAEKALLRIRSQIVAYNQVAPDLTLSLSLGAATGDRGNALTEILREADQNMYRDKISKTGLSQP